MFGNVRDKKISVPREVGEIDRLEEAEVCVMSSKVLVCNASSVT